jgi:hypothetical protein
MNEGQVNTIYNRLVETKKENKEAQEITTKIKRFSASEVADAKTKGESLPGGKAVKMNPDGSVDVTMEGKELSEEDTLNVVNDPDATADGMGMFEGEMTEKFESKAQQGLFWARCNKCKSENCKWCKMAKEFSKSTSKKQYKKMPEKKHPEKTVKYKKKKTNEEFTMANYFDKVTSVYANNAMGKTINSLTKEQFVKKHINKIVENNLRPTMKKKDLLKLIESEIKNKKDLNEDFYMEEMDEELDFDFMSDVETAPIIKPKIKPKRETEPEWEPDEDEKKVPDEEQQPQGKGNVYETMNRNFKKMLTRMDNVDYKPIKHKIF